MKIIKRYSHKHGLEQLNQERPQILAEIEAAVASIHAVDALTKVSREASKIRRWGGLLFSPPHVECAFCKSVDRTRRVARMG